MRVAVKVAVLVESAQVVRQRNPLTQLVHRRRVLYPRVGCTVFHYTRLTINYNPVRYDTQGLDYLWLSHPHTSIRYGQSLE